MEAKIRARLMARSKDAPKKPGQEPARPRVNSRSKSPGADASPSYMAGTARSEYRKAAFDTDEKRRADKLSPSAAHDRLDQPQIHDAAEDTFYEMTSSFGAAAAKGAPKGTAEARGGFAKRGNRSRFSAYGSMYADPDPLSTKLDRDRAAAAAGRTPKGRTSPKVGMTPTGHSPRSGIVPPGFASTPPQGRPNRANTMERARAAAQGLPAPNPHAPILKPHFSKPATRGVAGVVDVREPPASASPPPVQPTARPTPDAGRAGVARRGSALLAAALSGIDEGEDAEAAQAVQTARAPPPPPPPPQDQGQGEERARGRSSSGAGGSPMPQRPKRSPPKPPSMS